jgi:hypothetical protein
VGAGSVFTVGLLTWTPNAVLFIRIILSFRYTAIKGFVVQRNKKVVEG